MGMLIEGLNLIRDFWATLNDAAELGTGSTNETAQDTDLETPIAGSETSLVTDTTQDQFLKKVAQFNGTSAGGETVKEMIWKTASPELAGSRVVFTGTSWDTTADFNIETRWYWRGRRG